MSNLNTPRAPEGAQQGVLATMRAMPAAVKNVIVAASTAISAGIAGCADYGQPYGPSGSTGSTAGSTNNYYYVPETGSTAGGTDAGSTMNPDGTNTPNGTDTGSSQTGADTSSTGVDTATNGSTDVGTSTTPETTVGSGSKTCEQLIAEVKAKGMATCKVHTSAGDVPGTPYCVPTPQADGSVKLEVGCKS